MFLFLFLLLRQLFLDLFRQALLKHLLGQRQIVQRIVITRSQRQRGRIGINRTGIIAAFVTGIAQVIKGISLDVFTFDTGEGLAGIRVVAGTVKCDATTVIIGEFTGRIAVFTLFKFLRRLLFRVLEPGGIDDTRTEQAEKKHRTPARAEPPRHSGFHACSHALHKRFPDRVRRNSGSISSRASPASM